ncbi:AraC family transcriptional regulator [Myroides sp. WP-1]|uniref:helix-turn-helix domain-containing protein n=1 Tax=Myroides sp. WP-1 TaxID=2759944 RepID=UPI0021058804|nr:helix-turn-helix domain-containing protein [Myroides sp. WP-1]
MNLIVFVVFSFVGYFLMFGLCKGYTTLRTNISFICAILVLSSLVIYGLSMYEETCNIPVGSVLSLILGPLLLLLTVEQQKYERYYLCFTLFFIVLVIGSVLVYLYVPTHIEQVEETALKMNFLNCLGFGSYGYLNYINKKKNTKDQEVAILCYVVLLFLSTFFFSAILLREIEYFIDVNVLFLMFGLSVIFFSFLYECTIWLTVKEKELNQTSNKLKWKYFQETNVILEKSGTKLDEKKMKKENLKQLNTDSFAIDPKVVKQVLYVNLIETGLFLDNNLTLTKLAELTQLNKGKLNDYFKNSESMSFKQYINRLKVEHAINVIREREKNITVEELTFVCGFNTRLSFYRAFVYFYGFAPSELLSD